MALPVWELLGVFTAAFSSLFVQAASPPALALPQDIQYNEYVAQLVSNAAFSSDPQHLLDVQRESARQESGQTGRDGPLLEAFVINPQSCTNEGDEQTYRVTVRNMGNQAARTVSIQIQYPAEMRAVRTQPAAEHDEEKDLLVWVGQDLPPGGLLTMSYTLETAEQVPFYLNNLTVYYFADDGRPYVTLGERRLSGECGITDSIRSFLAGRPPIKPSIFCDPAEGGCVDTYRLLQLGRNYFRALSPEKRPIVCSQHDKELRQGLVPPCQDTLPQLGDRFAEAVADIIPGDCRVLEDDRIVEPALHDALSRRSKPAAPYLRPLYESGQDFRTLVHANGLQGIKHESTVRQTMQAIHHATWIELLKIAYSRLDGRLSSGEASSQMNSLLLQTLASVRNAQPQLTENYSRTQDERRKNFPRIVCGSSVVSGGSCKAVRNARASIAAACEGVSGERGDGNLGAAILNVHTFYENRLQQRENEYDTTQQTAAAAYADELQKWIGRLSGAFGALDANDPKALQTAVFEAAANDNTVFLTLVGPYHTHLLIDEEADESIRVTRFETALDTPKQIATSCEKEQRRPRGFCPRPETAVEQANIPGPCVPSESLRDVVYCENRATPPEQVKLTILRPGIGVEQGVPAQPIPQEFVEIDHRLTWGSSCSGRPGDPWWAGDCSCDCGSIVPVEEGSLQFCEPGTGIYTSGTDSRYPAGVLRLTPAGLALRQLLAPFRPLVYPVARAASAQLTASGAAEAGTQALADGAVVQALDRSAQALAVAVEEVRLLAARALVRSLQLVGRAALATHRSESGEPPDKRPPWVPDICDLDGNLVRAHSISVDSCRVTREATGGTAEVTITVRGCRDPQWDPPPWDPIEAAGFDISFTCETVDGTAQGGQDYVPFGPQTCTVAAGQSSLTIRIPVLADVIPEETEWFSFEATVPITPLLDAGLASGSIECEIAGGPIDELPPQPSKTPLPILSPQPSKTLLPTTCDFCNDSSCPDYDPCSDFCGSLCNAECNANAVCDPLCADYDYDPNNPACLASPSPTTSATPTATPTRTPRFTLSPFPTKSPLPTRSPQPS
ncbi:MAG: DUF11 domain-containing protein, partial [Candidatus Andersenbacteria bacterium]|nr:DUF11 domain-containing protein [Candidatus Andersenbacteria bacterium]